MAYHHMTPESLSALWADVVQRMGEEVAGLYDFKGSVATHAALPADAEAGDVYNVQAAYQGHPAGTNWAWTGSAWDALGGSMAGFAPLDSPALTGTPTAPTAAAGTATAQVATTGFVHQEMEAAPHWRWVESGGDAWLAIEA